MDAPRALTDQWRRLHPLSPLVRFGRLFVAVVVIAVPSLSTVQAGHGERLLSGLVWIALLAIGSLAGVIAWLVTRWRIDGGDLQIETGLIRRQSFRIPMARVQAVDVVAPLLARVLGLAEVRVVSAGRGTERGRLAYVSASEAPVLRAQLLALAHGLSRDTPEPLALPLFHVDNARLAAGLVLRAETMIPLLLAVIATVLLIAVPETGITVLSSTLVAIFAGVLAALRAFNDDFDLMVGEAGDGLRLDRGLLQRRHETIPYGRVQALRLVEPLLWRPFGWARLEVDIARQGDPRGEGHEARQVARTLVPVASRVAAVGLLQRVLPDAVVTPPLGARPPRRALPRAPFSYHFLAAWHDHDYICTRTGRVRSDTVVVPLDKIQSIRLNRGPLLRALRLASVHVDTAGHRWQASAVCRDEAEADRLLWSLAGLSGHARRRPRFAAGSKPIVNPIA